MTSMLEGPKDIEIWANAKLQGDWSAAAIVSQIDAAKLQMLSCVFNKGKLDHLVKVRLLVACMLLPSHRKTELASELSVLREAACSDEDEWVRVMANAVGDFSGRLDLESVLTTNQMVGDTVTSILNLLGQASTPKGFMPLEEMYLHPEIKAEVSTSGVITSRSQDHMDFRPREGLEAEAALPDFSIDTMLASAGLGPGSMGMARSKPGSASIHARRGTGLSCASMFLPSKTPSLAMKAHGLTAGVSDRLAPSGTLSEDGQSLTPRSALPGWQRPSKLVALAVGEAADLQRRASSSLLSPPLHSSLGQSVSSEVLSPLGVLPSAVNLQQVSAPGHHGQSSHVIVSEAEPATEKASVATRTDGSSERKRHLEDVDSEEEAVEQQQAAHSDIEMI